MPRDTSRTWDVIQKLSAVLGIIGFIAQVGGISRLAFLTIPVPIPWWALLIGMAFLMWLLPATLRHTIRDQLNQVPALADDLSKARHDAESLRRDNDQLKAECASQSARCTTSETKLLDLQQTLTAYRALESEIIGLLKNGGDFDLSEIARNTSAGWTDEGKRKVQAAIHALGNQIEGTGGSLPKYRLTRRAEPTGSTR